MNPDDRAVRSFKQEPTKAAALAIRDGAALTTATLIPATCTPGASAIIDSGADNLTVCGLVSRRWKK